MKVGKASGPIKCFNRACFFKCGLVEACGLFLCFDGMSMAGGTFVINTADVTVRED